MIYNNDSAREIAEYLLDIKAVVLNPSQPFTWASGILSPIYCDNRKALSYPEVRNHIKTAFADIIDDEFRQVEVIAGVATAGIAHAALVADLLNKPMIYVRDKPKVHGMGNQIEGFLPRGAKVVVIEDLISTGGSSLKAVDAIREAGAEVLCLAAIFTYGFDQANQAFSAASLPYFTLSNYEILLEIAEKNDYIRAEDKDTLLAWYQNPQQWNIK
jgi:orotate phosphoribosyltransferase